MTAQTTIQNYYGPSWWQVALIALVTAFWILLAQWWGKVILSWWDNRKVGKLAAEGLTFQSWVRSAGPPPETLRHPPTELRIPHGSVLRDHTAEDPMTFDANNERAVRAQSILEEQQDADWRDQGRTPTVPPKAAIRWCATKWGLHFISCHVAGKKPTKLSRVLTVQAAAAYAEENQLRPCHMCNPLKDLPAPATITS
jgi:hypothetical protein